jgi:hypothetical protein
MPRPWPLGLLCLLGAIDPVASQVVVGERERLAFDRPEAWAMAYRSASTLNAGPGPRSTLPRGTLHTGLSLQQVPHVGRERRRVGFDGTKLEDLNKTPVFGALQVRMGLGYDSAIELSWTPPLTIGGAKPRDLFGVALERRMIEGARLQLDGRLYYQQGSISGDITCDRATAAQAIGSEGNPFGCRAPSRDRFSQRQLGLATTLGVGPDSAALQPFISLALTRLDLRTQVEAEVFGVVDRSLLQTRGTIRTLGLGARYRPDPAWEMTAGLAWTPLKVRRPPERRRASDDLYSLRVQLWRSWP